jgi:hypothetical protein
VSPLEKVIGLVLSTSNDADVAGGPLDAERSSPDANITDFGDAIWWAVTTMTTLAS